jgi:hypothetical protein
MQVDCGEFIISCTGKELVKALRSMAHSGGSKSTFDMLTSDIKIEEIDIDFSDEKGDYILKTRVSF